MPQIPKYKREKVNADTYKEKFGGLADQAAAQGYSEVAQAQKGLAAQHGQRAGMEVQSFAQRLNEFTAQIDQGMRFDATKRAQRIGRLDVAKRRKQVFELTKKYANDPELLQKKIDELGTATFEDTFSTFGRVYEDTVNKAYAAQIEMDAINALEMAKTASGGDPFKFKEAYRRYAEELQRGAPNELGSLAARQAFEKYGVRTFEQMMRAQQSEAASQTDSDIKGTLAALPKLIKDAASRGDIASVRASQGQLAALVQSEVQNGRLSPAEGKWIVRNSYTIAQTEEFKRYGSEKANSGEGWRFLQDIQNPESPYGKAFHSLPADAQQKVLADVKAATRAYEEAELGREKHDTETVEVYQQTNTRRLKEKIMVDGVKLTNEQLKTLEGEGSISRAQAKEIRAFQEMETDPATLTQYSDGSVLVNMTPGEIMEIPDISYTDKQKLLKQREVALKDPLYDWMKSRNGKEAMKRLKEDFDIPDSNIQVILAKVKGERTQQEEDFIQFRREMFDRISQFPYDQQPEKAMEVYNELHKGYAAKVEKRKAEERESQLTSKWQQYEKRAAEESEGWFASKKTPMDILEEDYKAKKISRGFYDRMKTKYGEKVKPVEQPFRDPPKVKKPMVEEKRMHLYTQPGTPEFEAFNAKAREMGVRPKITGKNVDLSNMNPKVTQAAYPIMNKYGLTIRDAHRKKPGGGAKRSQHLHGNALDVEGWANMSIPQKQEIIREFKRAGFTGFGVGPTTLHVDMRKTPSSWSYYGGSATGKGGIMPKWAKEALES